MVMASALFKAILSMDAYNRGYDAGIKFYEPDQNLDKYIGNFSYH